jgi:hypothetical protein
MVLQREMREVCRVKYLVTFFRMHFRSSFLKKGILIVNYSCQKVIRLHLLIVSCTPQFLQFLRQFEQEEASVSQHLISLDRIDAGTVLFFGCNKDNIASIDIYWQTEAIRYIFLTAISQK